MTSPEPADAVRSVGTAEPTGSTPAESQQAPQGTQPTPAAGVSNPWPVFALLAAIQFVVVLDTSIVYVALPSIDQDLGFSATGLVWVMDAYILAFGGLMLLGGRAADLFGRRRVLYAGLTFFGLASLACGLSTDSWQLVGARGAQGLAAAITAPAALALVTDVFAEGPARYRALGIFGGIGGVAGAAGVLVGGALTAISWQWVFLVNVPLVIVLLVLIARMVPATSPRAQGGVDLLGAAAGTVGLCLLLYAVLSASTAGWTSLTVVVQLGVAVLLLVGFVLRQMSATAPLIPRTLFRMPNVVLGNAANVMVGALLFGSFFVVTLFLQQVRDYSPMQAALRMVPISLFLFLGSQLTVRLIGRVGATSALAAGSGLQVVGLVWWSLALAPQDGIVTSFLLPGVIWGFGCGVAIVAAFVVCTSGLHGPVMGAASGLVSTSLQIGGAIGVAGLGLVMTGRIVAAPDPHTAEAAASGQAFAFGSAVLLAVLAIGFMVWLGRLRKPAGPAGGAGHE